MVNVYINHEKKFAFVEMRTVEEASNAMALDGIVFEVVFNALRLFISCILAFQAGCAFEFLFIFVLLGRVYLSE